MAEILARPDSAFVFRPGGLWSLVMLLGYSTQLYQAIGSIHAIQNRLMADAWLFNAKLVPTGHQNLRELDNVLNLTFQHCKHLRFEGCCSETARLRQAINSQHQA